ncbi:MAG: class I tRNA ligase family protein [Deltaproteobacteria bacterium]|nr:class I tRNA ligase family protein [Deltaproteobacteria bacterium]
MPLPLDDADAKDKVLYVWFDAPIGYISNSKELCAQLDGTPDTYKDW